MRNEVDFLLDQIRISVYRDEFFLEYQLQFRKFVFVRKLKENDSGFSASKKENWYCDQSCD